MESSSFWTDVSSAVQAISAAAIAVLTYVLVRFTRRTVDEMRTGNRLQEQANAISTGFLTQTQQAGAPFLVGVPGGGEGTIGGAATHRVVVQNRGGGLANDVDVETTWGHGQIGTLGAGDTANVSVRKDTGYSHGDNPEVRLFRFRDAQGTQWIQQPSQPPVREAEGTEHEP